MHYSGDNAAAALQTGVEALWRVLITCEETTESLMLRVETTMKTRRRSDLGMLGWMAGFKGWCGRSVRVMDDAVKQEVDGGGDGRRRRVRSCPLSSRQGKREGGVMAEYRQS